MALAPPSSSSKSDPLQGSLQFLKGVGPRRAADLQRAGLTTVEDLLYRFPARYEDRGHFQTIASLRPGVAASVMAEVLSCGIRPTRRRGFKIFEMLLRDQTGSLRAIWFNQPFLKDVFRPHQRVILFGKLELTSHGLQTYMAALDLPYIAMVGNHDRRATCIDALEAAPRDPNGFVQGTRQTPHGLCVFLDTLDETSHAGEMCAKRLGWLENTLAAAPADMPFLVFMHHPPFPVGIHAMDSIALKQNGEFAEVIAPYRARIRHLFFGHVHRPISGSYGTIPFSTLRGTNHQVWFELDPAADHLASHELPAYGVVLVDRETLVVHAHDFLDVSPRLPFAAPAGMDDRDYALSFAAP